LLFVQESMVTTYNPWIAHYFTQLKDLLLPIKEEQKLIKQAQIELKRAKTEKNHPALNKLVEGNLRYATALGLKRLKSLDHSTDPEEIISASNLGIFDAVRRYKFRPNPVKFSTCVFHGVRGAIQDYLRKESRQHRKRVTRTIEETPTVTEDILGKQDLNHRVNKALGNLSQIEKEVLELRYGLNSNENPATLEKVSQQYGLSIETIRNIQKRAENKMKTNPSLIEAWYTK